MKRQFHLSIVISIFLSLFVLVSESTAQDTIPWPTDGWHTSTPEEQGVDSQALDQLLETNSDAHTILAIRHGRVILDASRYPFTSDQLHAGFAIAKSVVSTLVGIAIEKDYIQSVQQSIWDFFPEAKTANMDARKEAITIEDLLTLRSGLLIRDDLDIYKLNSGDATWVQHILDEPMQGVPGEAFCYADANAHLVSAIIQIATHQSASDFAAQYLFGPLGIDDVIWWADPQGVNVGGNHLFMSPMSMAKLGYLYLHGGQWNGHQIVSADWVERSTIPYVKGANIDFSYGYFWWNTNVGQHAAISAQGLNGQVIWIVPDLDLIVVTTNDTGYLGKTIITSIANAVQSNQPLQANVSGVEALQARITAWENPRPTAIKQPASVLQAISGMVFELEDNELGWKSVSIDFAKPEEALFTISLPEKTITVPVGMDGNYRVSTDGLPADPAWRPIANVPQMARAGFLGKRMMILMGDCLGMDNWNLSISLSADGSKFFVGVQSLSQLNRIGSPPYNLVGAAIQ